MHVCLDVFPIKFLVKKFLTLYAISFANKIYSMYLSIKNMEENTIIFSICKNTRERARRSKYICVFSTVFILLSLNLLKTSFDSNHKRLLLFISNVYMFICYCTVKFHFYRDSTNTLSCSKFVCTIYI